MMMPPHGPIKKLSRQSGGGVRLNDCRGGDRAEYLAKYAISRFAFISEIPRQEDFGIIDFSCTLGAEEIITKGKREHVLIVPDSSFYVQVKSNTEPYILNSRLVKWVAEHVASPFFICIVDESNDDEVSFYSCTYIWQALTLISMPTQITFHFDEDKFNRSSKGYFEHSQYVRSEFENADGKVNILFGDPVFVAKSKQLERTTVSVKAFEEFKPYIDNDIKNIIRYRTERIMTSHIEGDEIQSIAYVNKNYSIAERSIIPVLMSLVGNYAVAGGEDSKIVVLIIYLKMLGIEVEDICNHFGPVMADAFTKISNALKEKAHETKAVPSEET